MEPGSGSERMRRLWWWWWWCVQFKYESIWVTFVVLIPLDQMSSPFHINTFNCVGMRSTWLLLRHRQLEDLLLNQLLPCDVTCDACLAPAELNKWRQTTSLYAITSSLCSTFRPFVPHFVPLSLFLHKGTSLYLCTPHGLTGWKQWKGRYLDNMYYHLITMLPRVGVVGVPVGRLECTPKYVMMML